MPSYEKGRFYVPRKIAIPEAVGSEESNRGGPVENYMNERLHGACDLVHYNALLDSQNNVIYDFVWLCP
jgi:hypothetical protein